MCAAGALMFGCMKTSGVDMLGWVGFMRAAGADMFGRMKKSSVNMLGGVGFVLTFVGLF